jgi:hypothetical protein
MYRDADRYTVKQINFATEGEVRIVTSGLTALLSASPPHRGRTRRVR